LPFDRAQAALHRASRHLQQVSKFRDRGVRVLASCEGNSSQGSTTVKGISLLKPPNRCRLTYPGSDGTLQVRRLSIYRSIQLTADLTQDIARLNLRNCASRSESPQEVIDHGLSLPHDDASTTSLTQLSGEANLREGVGKEGCLSVREHQFQMDVPRRERE